MISGFMLMTCYHLKKLEGTSYIQRTGDLVYENNFIADTIGMYTIESIQQHLHVQCGQIIKFHYV